VSHKLLLADDSITIQKVVELILAEEDFEIKSVGNGEEALAAIPSFSPDVVLADIEMPKMNGYQLCEKIKQAPATSSIPVILLTGAFEPVDEELTKQVGADDVLTKPFESQELISKINAALTVSGVAGGAQVETVTEAEAFPEAEAVAEAEPFGMEAAPVEEDLWAMEEMPETAEAEPWSLETGSGASTEELIGIAEEAELESALAIEAEPTVEETKAMEAPARKEASAREVAVPEMATPSKDDIQKMVKESITANMTALLSSINIKEAVLATLTPLLKDSVEKVLWEVAPDLVEKMLKEMLKGSLESLTKEVEKVIWETVPDLAETMISKEIERIKSAF
jgi:CheY-like chemotaxis protein